MSKPVRMEPGVKLRDGDKMALIPVKFMPDPNEVKLRKPEWMRIAAAVEPEDRAHQEHPAQEQAALCVKRLPAPTWRSASTTAPRPS